MNTAAPIEIDFYDEDDKLIQTYSRARIPSYLLDMAINLQAEVNAGEDGRLNTDALFDFIVEFFGRKFTRDELKQKSDLVECMAVLQAVITRATALSREFAKANPPVPSLKKK